MPFFNPQRVEFHPFAPVIENAGAMGAGLAKFTQDFIAQKNAEEEQRIKQESLAETLRANLASEGFTNRQVLLKEQMQPLIMQARVLDNQGKAQDIGFNEAMNPKKLRSADLQNQGIFLANRAKNQAYNQSEALFPEELRAKILNNQRNTQAYNQSEALFPHQLERAGLQNKELTEKIKTDKALRPSRINAQNLKVTLDSLKAKQEIESNNKKETRQGVIDNINQNTYNDKVEKLKGYMTELDKADQTIMTLTQKYNTTDDRLKEIALAKQELEPILSRRFAGLSADQHMAKAQYKKLESEEKALNQVQNATVRGIQGLSSQIEPYYKRLEEGKKELARDEKVLKNLPKYQALFKVQLANPTKDFKKTAELYALGGISYIANGIEFKNNVDKDKQNLFSKGNAYLDAALANQNSPDMEGKSGLVDWVSYIFKNSGSEIRAKMISHMYNKRLDDFNKANKSNRPLASEEELNRAFQLKVDQAFTGDNTAQGVVGGMVKATIEALKDTYTAEANNGALYFNDFRKFQQLSKELSKSYGINTYYADDLPKLIVKNPQAIMY